MDVSSNSGLGHIYTNSNIVFYKLADKHMGCHTQTGWAFFSKHFFISSSLFYHRDQSKDSASIKPISDVHHNVRHHFRYLRNLSEPRLQSFSIRQQYRHGTNSPDNGKPNICSLTALSYHSNNSNHLFSRNLQKKIP